MYIHPIISAAEKVLVGTEKLNGTQIAAMTIIGLLVVFSALLILVAFLYGSGSLFKKSNSAKPPAPKKPAAPAPVKQAAKPAAPARSAQAAPAPAPAASAEDDAEVVAVIMAAIAAMGAAEGKQYQLRSVKQVTRGGGRSVWAQAGLSDATRPF